MTAPEPHNDLPLIALAGPTASGKTAGALALAAVLGKQGQPVEIISAQRTPSADPRPKPLAMTSDKMPTASGPRPRPIRLMVNSRMAEVVARMCGGTIDWPMA